jgi:serine/threonine protein phosphatase PrpC
MRQEEYDEPALSGMEATLVLALIRGAQTLIVHLGDSRAYL